jgi:DNA polymerase-3 subunit alpha
MFLIFDTETTGTPKNYNAPLSDFDNWPRMVQLAWQIHDENGELLEVHNHIIKPEGYKIPHAVVKIHGITTERALREGKPLEEVLNVFNKALSRVTVIAGHNIEFDINITGAEFLRKKIETPLHKITAVDTKELSTNFCKLPGGRGGKYKWPTLGELYRILFNEDFDAAHNASADVQATARCFLELIRLGVIKAEHLNMPSDVVEKFKKNHQKPIESIGLNVESYHEKDENEAITNFKAFSHINLSNTLFTHLHNHTQFSVLDGLSDIPSLVKKAKDDGMKAVAITDHGNMFGVKKFHDVCVKEGLKPIIGCEMYVARRGMDIKKESKLDGGGWHLVLLAKNRKGYENLLKLVSKSWTEGYYYKPRIDKKLLKKHREGLIALTACLGGEVPSKIVNEGIEKGEEAALEYKCLFGDDLYLELQRHPSGNPEMDRKVYQDQVYVNKALLEIGEKHNIKVVATNDAHFINKEDADAHDRLICIGTGKDVDDPNRMRYTRQEWFKTQEEMKKLFADIPQAIVNTNDVVEKVEIYELNHKPIMPVFEIPDEFKDANDYLRHITYEGAKFRYQELSDNIKERIDFELETIRKMGFPDYFLIVWDFLKAARDMGVIVGPGRGSAAGSVVAYCLRITEIDPIKYDLLFERFLNPDRISMPDIDIDFDEDGRDKILKWVSKKYGRKRVAHLITFGTMAAKMAIRDVARVQKLPLSEADRLAKLVPDTPGISLQKAFEEVPELKKQLKEGSPEIQSVLKSALTLEGSVRNTGTHACGIIIGRDDLENYVPVSTVKDSMLDISTQYDGKFIESIGLLKMDFLGLKTLSIIKDAVVNIKRSKNIEIDISSIPLDDKKTYELYSRGETTALFQFESDGMKKYLRELKPTRFGDLIAMNALYRPGPMQYIPEFIDRKHGRKKIVYDLPIMEEILKETYGITVYQEQVMLLSRKMAGFTRGESDSLRKAMGKKKIEEMNKLKVKFIEGCKKNNLPVDKVEKVWHDWEEFAKYAFNKSHATCYSYVSYQTAYLKAHYPAEFMAAVLSRNLNNIDKITFFIKETKRMGIPVLGPDINESAHNFTVNKDGVIRFGLAAIKGVGGSAVEDIVREREKNGHFVSIFDFAKRVNLKSVNKRSFEALAMAGAFDTFSNVHRAQYFHKLDNDAHSFIEKVVKHGASVQEQKKMQQFSLFGDMDDAFQVKDPEIPKCEPWSKLQKLKYEKEVTGFYISGHPLDDHEIAIKRYCSVNIDHLKNNLKKYKDKTVTFAGMVSDAGERMTKTGNPFGVFNLEDYTGGIRLVMFSETYLKFKHFLYDGATLFVTAKIENRIRSQEDSELMVQISDMMLLSEVLNKRAQSVVLKLRTDEFTNGFSETIVNAVKNNGGKTPVEILLLDISDKRVLQLKSPSARIDPESFIKEIEKINVTYEIK